MLTPDATIRNLLLGENTMKRLENILIIGFAIVFFGALALLISRIEACHESERSEYSYSVVVDDSSKLPQAITNAVNAVTSKGFILTYLSITKTIIGNNNITVRAGGKDLAKILEM